MLNLVGKVGEFFAYFFALLFAFSILLASLATLGLVAIFVVIMRTWLYVLAVVLLIVVGNQMGYL